MNIYHMNSIYLYMSSACLWTMNLRRLQLLLLKGASTQPLAKLCDRRPWVSGDRMTIVSRLGYLDSDSCQTRASCAHRVTALANDCKSLSALSDKVDLVLLAPDEELPLREEPLQSLLQKGANVPAGLLTHFTRRERPCVGRSRCERTAPMKVLCFGFPRTGTACIYTLCLTTRSLTRFPQPCG